MKRNSVTIALVSLLVLNIAVVGVGHAQGQYGTSPIGSRMLADSGTTSFPFELQGGLIVLTASVNGAGPFRLVLDTGMPIDGLMLEGGARADSLHLPSSGKIRITGAGGGQPIEADIIQGVTVGFPGMELTNATATLMPYDSVWSRIVDFDGVIGYAIFSRFVVEIDYGRETITLTEPDRFTGTGRGEELPIHFAGNIPFLNCTAEMENGRTVPLELAIDTGASHALLLNIGSREGIDLPKRYLDGVIARGLTNRITLEIGRITSLHLGKTALSEVLTTFSSKKMHPLEKEGNLGSKTLCRFRVTFDYRSQRMFLEPTTGYDAPFEFNMAGIQFVRAEEGRFKIERVFPDSPASEAELAEQDLILAVDGRPAGEYTLDELESLFRREGRKVALIVLHEGRTSDIRLKLRRLI